MWKINKAKRIIREFFYKSNFHKIIDKRSDTLTIFGNGYSIANMDIRSYKNQDCFVCNEFYRFPNFVEFVKNNNVTYFGMDGMESFHGFSQMMGYSLSHTLELLIDPWVNDTAYSMIIPPSMLTYFKSKTTSTKLGVLGSDVGRLLHNRITGLKIDRNVASLACRIRHTPQAMILAGLILGYKNINLYGVDHTYVRDILNKDPMTGKHFYLESIEEVLLVNRNHKDQTDYSINLSELFENNTLTFKTYECQQIIAKALEIQIQDKTNGSLFCFQDFNLSMLIEMESKNQKNI